MSQSLNDHIPSAERIGCNVNPSPTSLFARPPLSSMGVGSAPSYPSFKGKIGILMRETCRGRDARKSSACLQRIPQSTASVLISFPPALRGPWQEKHIHIPCKAEPAAPTHWPPHLAYPRHAHLLGRKSHSRYIKASEPCNDPASKVSSFGKMSERNAKHADWCACWGGACLPCSCSKSAGDTHRSSYGSGVNHELWDRPRISTASQASSRPPGPATSYSSLPGMAIEGVPQPPPSAITASMFGGLGDRLVDPGQPSKSNFSHGGRTYSQTSYAGSIVSLVESPLL